MDLTQYATWIASGGGAAVILSFLC